MVPPRRIRLGKTHNIWLHVFTELLCTLPPTCSWLWLPASWTFILANWFTFSISIQTPHVATSRCWLMVKYLRCNFWNTTPSATTMVEFLPRNMENQLWAWVAYLVHRTNELPNTNHHNPTNTNRGNSWQYWTKTSQHSELVEVEMAEKIHRSSYESIMQRLLLWKQVQARKRSQKHGRPDTALSPLESLPMELMQIILGQLDDVSLVCLKNTATDFRALIPPIEGKNLSRCQTWLIMCRFETDMKEYPPFVACAFCKIKRPQKDFGLQSFKHMRWSMFCNRDHRGMGYLKPMNLQPIDRYCCRHMTTAFGWPPRYREAEKVKWVRTPEPTCLHCGSKPASCGQLGLKFLHAPKTQSHCTQACGVCPTRWMATYSRHGPINSPRLRSKTQDFVWDICREPEGRRLWMREWNGKIWFDLFRIEVTIF